MLRSVLGDYLEHVKERDFDLPLLSLLPALGFYDIHFTHGPAEFGKDIIAKKHEDQIEVQYTFQSKAGNINQGEWRNSIQGQIFEAVMNTLSHPNFDSSMPHQVILVTTGRLIGNAPVALQNLNQQLVETYCKRAVIVWDREQLLPFIEDFGLSGIHNASASGYANYASFFNLYSRVLSGQASAREIEPYTRIWLEESIDLSQRLLWSAIETEIFAQGFLQHGHIYEAIQIHLASLRTILFSMHDASELGHLIPKYQQAIEKLKKVCEQYIDSYKSDWEQSEENLLQIPGNTYGMMGYLVSCSRILEIAGLLYFLESEPDKKATVASFLERFVLEEKGAGRVVGDYHAISLALPILALKHSEKVDIARQLVQHATVWLCDRYEEGAGLAAFEADAHEETRQLLGYAFEFIKLSPNNGSFLATLISDLAAFVDNKDLYPDVVNDIKASKIFPVYWQPADSNGVYRIESKDVVSYPNIEFDDECSSFEAFDYAEHIRYEPTSFKVANDIDIAGFSSIMLLLRDRYFPTLWPALLKQLEGLGT